MARVVTFEQRPVPGLAEVGGKGLSLIQMAQAGLAVPPGLVLTVAFFEPWLARLREGPAWAAFREASEAELAARCEALKAEAAGLALDDAQRAELQAARAGLGEGLVAVRSSSPEEDLEGTSFAGGYETVLGVTPDRLEAAVRRAFASCLDARVAVYKRQHGLDWRSPRIAVVVQRQVASEVAGVGFSVNPLTNDHDEAVFNANWGLGETVVAGLASPDLYVVDRANRAVLQAQVGKKETSIWLRPDGGTEERADPRHAERTLSDAQLAALAEQLDRIEAHFGKPMDIEWAFEGGRLHLLQARPITTHLALPPRLLTKRGEPRRLYWDVTISVQGLFEPLSPLGTSTIEALLRAATRFAAGRSLVDDPATSPVQLAGGRAYAVASQLAALVGKERLVAVLRAVDGQASAALAATDLARYPPNLGPLKGVRWHLLWKAPARLATVARARLAPERHQARLDQAVDRLRQELGAVGDDEAALADLLGRLIPRVVKVMFGELLPALVMGKFVAMSGIRELFANATPEQQRQVERLDQSLPHNVTVEMGLELARAARLAPAGVDAAALRAMLAEGRAPAEFQQAWEAFIARYGHRGPQEIDAAAPRFREDPTVLLRQVEQLAGAPDPAQDPIAIYERSREERRRAAEALREEARKRGVARKFEALYRVVETLAGYRETPKFCLVLVVDRVRRIALARGRALAAAGRLDRPEDVFGLTLDELARASAEPGLDLRAARAAHAAESASLRRAKALPRLIDSRGRILRPPPPPVRPGEWAGQPVSPGVVRGRVKVLHAPDEKPLLRGEILVARATDPGWTPLFVNAAAVVLEVGGLMQHGALVAREYGKPCVAGVEDATSVLRDGAWVEVDGTAGVVRPVEEGTR